MSLDLSAARRIAGQVVDPELPDLTISEMGMLRDVAIDQDTVVVTVTPTFSGCPALDVIQTDVVRALHTAGFERVRIETALHPPWSSDWISAEGRGKLAAAGIAPPTGKGTVAAPVSVGISVAPRAVCPQCGSERTTRLSAYAATACRSLYRCDDCREPFDAIKPV